MTHKNQMCEPATLYVTFSLSEPGSRWRWGVMPDRWEWAGSTDMMRENSKVEEWFSGPEESIGKMKRYLNKIFRELEAEGVVKRYRVSTTRSLKYDGKKGWPRGFPP